MRRLGHRRFGQRFGRRFGRDESGVVAVETGLLLGVFVLAVGGSIEMGLLYHAQSQAHQAARHGARLAATEAPVAGGLDTMTGLDGTARPGDPLPPYLFECEGAAQRCNRGPYNSEAMRRLVEGVGAGAGNCARQQGRQSGMCAWAPVERENVTVRYEGSGLGTAGQPAAPLPIISVSVGGLRHDAVFLGRLFPNGYQVPTVTATVMAEDLRSAP